MSVMIIIVMILEKIFVRMWCCRLFVNRQLRLLILMRILIVVREIVLIVVMWRLVSMIGFVSGKLIVQNWWKLLQFMVVVDCWMVGLMEFSLLDMVCIRIVIVQIVRLMMRFVGLWVGQFVMEGSRISSVRDGIVQSRLVRMMIGFFMS